MNLSPQQEDEFFEALERQLADNFPQRVIKRFQTFRYRMWVLAVGLVSGLGIILFGVSQGNVVVGVLGFILMLAVADGTLDSFQDH